MTDERKNPQSELLQGRVAKLRDIEDPGVVLNIDISSQEILQELKGLYRADGKKKQSE